MVSFWRTSLNSTKSGGPENAESVYRMEALESRGTYKRHLLDLQDGYSCDSQGSQEGRLAVGETKVPAPDQLQFMDQSGTSESDESENN